MCVNKREIIVNFGSSFPKNAKSRICQFSPLQCNTFAHIFSWNIIEYLETHYFLFPKRVKLFYFPYHAFPDICQRISNWQETFGLCSSTIYNRQIFFYTVMKGCLNLKMIREAFSILGQLYYLLESSSGEGRSLPL